jgi:hypothetical protein
LGECGIPTELLIAPARWRRPAKVRGMIAQFGAKSAQGEIGGIRRR